MSFNETQRKLSDQIIATKDDLHRKAPKIQDGKTFKQTTTVDDSRFGKVKVWVHEASKSEILAREKMSNKKENAETDIKNAKRRLLLNNEFLQSMVDWSSEEHKGFCSTTYKVNSYFENTGVNAEELMKKQHFTHRDLTFLAYRMLHALSWIHQHGETFNDLRSTAVANRERALDNDWLLCDLTTSYVSAHDILAINRMNVQNNTRLYCAPELYKKAFKSSKKAYKKDARKADMFALGMILLECGLGKEENTQKCYDLKGKKFQQETLTSLVNKFKTQFQVENSLLCEIVERLLTFAEKERNTPEQLLECIPPLEQIRAHFGKQYTCSTTTPRVYSEEPVCHEPTRVTYTHPVSYAHSRPVEHVTQTRRPVEHVVSQGTSHSENKVVKVTIRRMDPKTGEVISETTENPENYQGRFSYSGHHNVLPVHSEQIVKSSHVPTRQYASYTQDHHHSKVEHVNLADHRPVDYKSYSRRVEAPTVVRSVQGVHCDQPTVVLRGSYRKRTDSSSKHFETVYANEQPEDVRYQAFVESHIIDDRKNSSMSQKFESPCKISSPTLEHC